MIFTARMTHLTGIVLDRDIEIVTKELLRQSVLHFVDIKPIEGQWSSRVQEVTPQISEALIAETRKRIDSLMSLANLSPESELNIENLKPVDLEQSNRTLDALATEMQGTRERQRLLQQEILKLQDIHRQLELYGNLQTGVSSSQYSFLSFHTGSLPTERLEAFTGALKVLPSVQLNFQEQEGRTAVLLIAMKRDDKQINKLLDSHGWLDAELPEEMRGAKQDAQEALDSRLTGLRQEQAQLENEVQTLIREKQPDLDSMWASLRMNELLARIQSNYGHTARTVLFSGWLPVDKQRSLAAELNKVTAGRCYLEWSTPREIEQTAEAPVQLKNPRFLAPFQMLVQNYATPEYGTIDPTPLVAVAYLVMFGLMFGDAGHGLVLVITGILGSLLYKGKSENWSKLLQLVVWCGASSIVTGILFGSYFGMAWFKPLWFDYHGIISGHGSPGVVKDIYGVLVITIYFGIAVIALGLVLNWINLIIRRRWLKLVLDKGGLVGGWVYGAGVYAAFYFVNHAYRQLPPTDLLFWLFGLPVILFMFKAPLEFFQHRRGRRFTLLTPVDWFMEWIVEILEIFSGYLANTLSFMRVAGLGIAHVSLMIAFFQIAEMVGSGSGGYGIGSVAILILGNALVIALEGLSAGIQSLRLNYYEFFSKYFSGTGTAYAPVSLRRR